jgi:predicted amidophosphoribosyltransferase
MRQELETEQVAVRRTDLRGSRGICCESCGRPLDLWCEDCGCPVSCHDFIYPGDTQRLPYCLWDFGPCAKERRPVFFAALEAWLHEVREHLRGRSQAA